MTFFSSRRLEGAFGKNLLSFIFRKLQNTKDPVGYHNRCNENFKLSSFICLAVIKGIYRKQILSRFLSQGSLSLFLSVSLSVCLSVSLSPSLSPSLISLQKLNDADIIGWCKNNNVTELKSNIAQSSKQILTARDGDGDTCLCEAVGDGIMTKKEKTIQTRQPNLEVVELLINANITESQVNSGCRQDTDWRIQRWNSLLLSSEFGQPEVTKLLLEAGAHVNVSGGYRNGSPLHGAASNPNQTSGTANAELLLNAGANVEARDMWNDTPLHYASFDGHNETVALLLDRGANIEAQRVYGETPLHVASSNGHSETVTLLLDAGANVDAQTKNGWTPLHRASWYGHRKTVTLLLDAGANIEAQTNNGWTPLHTASFFGCKETVLLLGKAGANIEARDNDGETPLHLASENRQKETVALLLDAGANADALNNRGRTPLDFVFRWRFQ